MNKEQKEIIEKLAKNSKIKKAIKGLLSPLQQEGDNLVISFGKERRGMSCGSIKIDYEDKTEYDRQTNA